MRELPIDLSGDDSGTTYSNTEDSFGDDSGTANLNAEQAPPHKETTNIWRLC